MAFATWWPWRPWWPYWLLWPLKSLSYSWPSLITFMNLSIMTSGQTLCLLWSQSSSFTMPVGCYSLSLSKLHAEGTQFPKDILFQWNQLNTNAPPLLCQKGNPLTDFREWDSLRFLETYSFKSIFFWWTFRTKQGILLSLTLLLWSFNHIDLNRACPS